MAQILTVFHGATSTVYFLCIGIYSFFLGMGAFYYEGVKYRTQPTVLFIRAELGLVVIVLISPLVVLFSGAISSTLIKYFIGFLPLVLISFFSGVELPYLLGKALNKSDKDQIVFWDFLGMCASGLLFAFLLVESFSIIRLLVLGLLINCVLLLPYSYKKRKKWYSLAFLFFMLISLLIFIFDTQALELFRTMHGH